MIVITLATQRSGTKLLGQMLSSGSQVQGFGEVFNPSSNQIFAFSNFIRSRSNKNEISSDSLLDEYFRSLLSVTPSVHVDIMYNQMEYCCTTWNPFPFPFIHEYLKTRKAAIIHLQRDPRDSFISQKVLEITREPHSYENKNSEKMIVRLKKSEYIDFISGINFHRQLAHSRFSGYDGYIEVKYEEIALKQKVPQNVLDMLEVAASAVGTPFLKERVQQRAPSVKRPERNIRIEWV